MSNLDLRGGIIPARVRNEYKNGNVKKEYYTVDLIFLDDYYYWHAHGDDCLPATDSALVHNIDESDLYYWWLRSAYDKNNVHIAGYCGWSNATFTFNRSLGLRPTLLYNLPSKNSTDISKARKPENVSDDFEPKIIEIKNVNGDTAYHCLLLGKQRGKKVDEELNKTLENLYNGGELKEGLIATGQWYTNNGQKKDEEDFAGAYTPVFEYKGKRYVREISYPSVNSYDSNFSDGTIIGEPGRVIWLKEEDYSWIIRNWDDLPKSINPNGSGKAKYFYLLSEEITVGNIPFYPSDNDDNRAMWQNSMPRGFLNGIDVRNIRDNGDPAHGASRGGDFTGPCNFLNETFNLGREPILEFKIPESQTEIPDDAFNRLCIFKKDIYTFGSNINWKRSF